MNADQMLRDSLWKQEITNERSLFQAIQDGQICRFCHGDLSDALRPCWKCEREAWHRALLRDAFSFYGVEPDLAYIIANDLKRGSSKNFESSRMLAARELRERRARYR